MKKLVAILCVVAMMIMAVSAFAAPSASSTVTVLTEGVEVERVDPAEIADPDVKKVVTWVNEDGGYTPEQVATELESADSAQAAAVAGYSFTSQFMKIDAAGDIEIADTNPDTLLMFIGEDGNLIIIERNADGTFTIPGPGIFAVIDK